MYGRNCEPPIILPQVRGPEKRFPAGKSPAEPALSIEAFDAVFDTRSERHAGAGGGLIDQLALSHHLAALIGRYCLCLGDRT